MTLESTFETRLHHRNELLAVAFRLGATKVAIIPASAVCVDDKLAEICREPQCENYGLSPSCPPHVSGPDGFRTLLKTASHAVVVRIEVPSAVLFSEERNEVMALLHEVVAGVEKTAKQLRYPKPTAFAGGSCKTIFCHDHFECRRLSKKGTCRNPQYARPSMSGFGIHVSKLMSAAGWSGEKETANDPDTEPMSWVTGMVLI